MRVISFSKTFRPHGGLLQHTNMPYRNSLLDFLDELPTIGLDDDHWALTGSYQNAAAMMQYPVPGKIKPIAQPPRAHPALGLELDGIEHDCIVHKQQAMFATGQGSGMACLLLALKQAPPADCREAGKNE